MNSTFIFAKTLFSHGVCTVLYSIAISHTIQCLNGARYGYRAQNELAAHSNLANFGRLSELHGKGWVQPTPYRYPPTTLGPGAALALKTLHLKGFVAPATPQNGHFTTFGPHGGGLALANFLHLRKN